MTKVYTIILSSNLSIMQPIHIYDYDGVIYRLYHLHGVSFSTCKEGPLTFYSFDHRPYLRIGFPHRARWFYQLPAMLTHYCQVIRPLTTSETLEFLSTPLE